jgi:hypothetical protein
MPNFMLLATAWGPKFGGINAFNMDFALGLASHLGEGSKVFCAVFQPTTDDITRAKPVILIPVDRPIDSPAYDRSWTHEVWHKFKEQQPKEQIDWWVGHDVTTGWAAIEGPSVANCGHSALIMHMNYADYQSFKSGVGERAQKKHKEQCGLFQNADRCFANGPLLRDALSDIVNQPVTMLVPGFANVPARPAAHRLHVITFGRMDRESDRIKQGALAVAGFASAIKQAWSMLGSPQKLKDNPQMRVIGIDEPGGEEEHALRNLANTKADREVNLIALRFDENRDNLFSELGRANIALMLSWHEGFGLTGWEAVAGEVPLIVSEQTGLWQLLKETFGERLARGYVRTIDVRGQEGGDGIANFRPEDEANVCDAIIDCVANLDAARSNAKKLKLELYKECLCTWANTAKQFCEGLGIKQAKDAAHSPPALITSVLVPKSDFVAIPSLRWPDDLAARGLAMPDSMLLRPEARIVRFNKSREPLLETIISWAHTLDAPIKLRLQTGVGGSGKTRSLIEVCDRLETQYGWRAGFLDRFKPIALGLPALLKEGKRCLIVLDYAETRTKEIVELIETALLEKNIPDLRLVLLAREGGDWWDRLADSASGDLVAAGILRGVTTKTGPYRMAKERIELSDRNAFFEQALIDFAAWKKIPVPAHAPPDLSDDLFGDPLFIHLSALAHLRGAAGLSDLELLAAAVGHERKYWQYLLNEGAATQQDISGIEQAVALLTLCSPKRSAKEAKDLLAHTPRLRYLPSSTRTALFDLLRRVYPRDGGLAGLQPDLLGETLVSECLATDDELLDVVFGPDSSQDDIRHALTVLTRLARRVPSEDKWLRKVFDRNLARIADDVLHVGLETGSPLPEVFAEVLSKAERPQRRHAIDTLRPKLPKETLGLDAKQSNLSE